MNKCLTRWSLALATAVSVALPASADVLTLDVSGINSQDVIGSAANTVLNFNLGALAHINSLSWQVNLDAYNPSWLSELQLSLSGAQTSSAGLLLAPGAGSDFSGSQAFGGSIDLLDQGLDFSVGADGILRLEFSEAASDGLSPDGRWVSGQVVIDWTAAAVPEPAGYALFGLGLVLMAGLARSRKLS
ncbi:PEP-CTERM sorting domain-containing protein [Paucibacter sp. B2R-40]|uniref:PEP-CTERM sorting domain-containing protein n=1 Tax=Paucibacter sp. B2R-40 TaxID=2893554 RepID=UPI0021E3C995|nr:PEP-CTERM sorting domain-containing protein [Paucibacter sp. B2R-40]MCV2353505.1 PEP-CTERM sorting domain-containing protein [Paucibacter sp. B2R-40]